ncbi:MAG: hypothetical protein B7C24_12775 [Bacteroidetes bacterium 4572_77]|nr:MAG: hypothetical protein B7C24_12775 [Bacteroidetes bacterium 4572_77]
MTNSIQLFEQHGLVNANLSYSEISNAFLSTGYTSGAGNTYFNSVRIAEGILIKEDVGIAHWGMSFLNGIQIYAIKDKTLIADEAYHSLRYSKYTVQFHAKILLLNTLREAAQSKGEQLNEIEANRVLDKVLNQAMNEDQRQLLIKQSQKYLGA